MDATHQRLDQEWRRHWAPLIARLVSRYHRLDLAEDALAGAFETAAERWPVDGTPANPAGWLLTVARNRILDALRTETVAARAAAVIAEDAVRTARLGIHHDGTVVDEFALVMLVCTPDLPPHAQAAAALRFVVGLTTAEIARLFVVDERTMAARLTRARARLARSDPREARAQTSRVEGVLRTIHLTFTAGYAPVDGDAVTQIPLVKTAFHLLDVVDRALPRRPDVVALRAVMLLQHARRDARTGVDGLAVLLPDQDRTAWRQGEVDEGLRLATSLTRGIGYAEILRLQALIAATHSVAFSAADTDWALIVTFYDGLLRLENSSVVRLNRAVAISERDGAAAGLAELDAVLLPGDHRPHAVRAHLLHRLHRNADALQELDRALDLCPDGHRRRLLRAQRQQVSATLRGL